MSSTTRRIEKLEDQLPADDHEPLFEEIMGPAWTAKEKREALAQYPDCSCFRKPLSMTLPCGEIEQRPREGMPPVKLGEFFHACRGTAAYRAAVRRVQQNRDSASPEEKEM